MPISLFKEKVSDVFVQGGWGGGGGRYTILGLSRLCLATFEQLLAFGSTF